MLDVTRRIASAAADRVVRRAVWVRVDEIVALAWLDADAAASSLAAGSHWPGRATRLSATLFRYPDVGGYFAGSSASAATLAMPRRERATAAPSAPRCSGSPSSTTGKVGTSGPRAILRRPWRSTGKRATGPASPGASPPLPHRRKSFTKPRTSDIWATSDDPLKYFETSS